MGKKFNGINMPYFDKKDSNYIKGIALILMYIHHFFTFPNWWIVDFKSDILRNMALYLQRPTKICVPVFAFLTGYFYYYSDDKGYKYVSRKIVSLVGKYWFIFGVFAFAAVFFCDYHYCFKDVALECVALVTPTMYFCWYVYFYMFSLLIFPIANNLIERHSLLAAILLIILLPTMFEFSTSIIKNDIYYSVAKNMADYFPLVIGGYYFAMLNVFNKMDVIINNEKKNMICSILIIVVLVSRFFWQVIYIKSTYTNIRIITADLFYVPIFIFSILNVHRIARIKGYIEEVGKYSLLMWFSHSIFFGNAKILFQPVLYYPKNPFVVLLWGLTINYVFARIISKFFVSCNHLGLNILRRRGR